MACRSILTRTLCNISMNRITSLDLLLKPGIKPFLDLQASVHTTSATYGVKSWRPFAKPTVPNVVCRGHVLAEKVEGYTIKPLKTKKTGGRGPDGHTEIKRIGGGDKRWFRMVDMKRMRPDQDSVLHERVHQVLKDDCRSAHIALVSNGEHRRYVIATENMKDGDLIKTHKDIPRMAVRAAEGDAHPVGALALGTTVCCVERLPGDGARVATAAGSSAILIRKVDGQCIIKMPSKREMQVPEKCIAVVGRVSNVDHGKTPYGKAGAKRWLGYRPHSGWWQRKTGIHGRKIRPIPPARVYKKPEPPKVKEYKFSF